MLKYHYTIPTDKSLLNYSHFYTYIHLRILLIIKMLSLIDVSLTLL